MATVTREANEDDTGVLADLLRRAFRDVAERFDLTAENCPKNLAFCTEQRIKDDLERGVRYYILEEERKICGCIALERAKPDVCYLMRLAVLPGHRGKGHGKMLVHHIFEKARDVGAQRVEIAMISKDRKLKNWYKKLGFLQKGTKRFDHLPFTVAFMYRELSREEGE
ncbi:MAG: GNAT family N-acetyltransferase [Phycisphaerales bacterium]|nr:MAG: GNAT family N-acetyltransferase [Phycisphaerales bacterium]